MKGGDNGRNFFKLLGEEATAQWPMLLSNFNLTLILSHGKIDIFTHEEIDHG
jgi:hypothetical protein